MKIPPSFVISAAAVAIFLLLETHAAAKEPEYIEPKENALNKFPNATVQPGKKLVLELEIPAGYAAHLGFEASGWVKYSEIRPAGELPFKPMLAYASAGTLIAKTAGKYQIVFENTSQKSIRLKFPKGPIAFRPPRGPKPPE